MSAPAIRLEGVAFRYPDGRQALDEVSLELASGASLGVIGPNGAGKTTLIEVIAGLHDPSEGSVDILGRRFGDGDDRELRRQLGVVFQETEDQLFSPTVFDDVAFGPRNFGLAESELAERVSRTLELVGLKGFEERVPHHLSSGERRRVALASVLSYEPSVLLLDEPTSGLDPRGRRELLGLLRSTEQARLVASHDLEFILRTCEQAVVIDRGRIVASGPTTTLLSNGETLNAHGLEAPLGLRGLDEEALRALLDGD